jgi:hypothetical protein
MIDELIAAWRKEVEAGKLTYASRDVLEDCAEKLERAWKAEKAVIAKAVAAKLAKVESPKSDAQNV